MRLTNQQLKRIIRETIEDERIIRSDANDPMRAARIQAAITGGSNENNAIRTVALMAVEEYEMKYPNDTPEEHMQSLVDQLDTHRSSMTPTQIAIYDEMINIVSRG